MTAQLFHIGGVARGHLPPIVDPVDGVTALAADSITYVVRRNGVDTAETITISSLATGLNEWTYNPADESEGEQISIRFTITVTDSGSNVHTVFHAVDLVVVAVERGTNGANTTVPDNTTIALIYELLQLTDSDVDKLVTRIAGVIRTAAEDATAETAQTDAIRDGLATTGTGGDTLGTLSDQLDALATAIAGVGGGSLTAEQQAQLDVISAKVALITAGRLQWVGSVSPGGDIESYIGDDDVLDASRDRRRKIRVSDAGGTLHAWLTSEAVAEILFGAGTGPTWADIVGTVAKSGVTHDAETNTTTIAVSIPAEAKEGSDPDCYEYHIVSVDAQGKRSVEVSGGFTLLPRRA